MATITAKKPSEFDTASTNVTATHLVGQPLFKAANEAVFGDKKASVDAFHLVVDFAKRAPAGALFGITDTSTYVNIRPTVAANEKTFAAPNL